MGADVGPGCSELPLLLIEHCRVQGHQLHLLDSAEMLEHLPEADFIHKTAAQFPRCSEFICTHRGRFDAILCYSVLQYAFIEVAFYAFIDSLLSLLAPGGHLLIGDIPNVSKRKRFFASETGIRFHLEFMKTAERPSVEFNCIEEGRIDDAVVVSIIERARTSGFDAYILPQHPSLAMANRREDILIVRP